MPIPCTSKLCFPYTYCSLELGTGADPAFSSTGESLSAVSISSSFLKTWLRRGKVRSLSFHNLTVQKSRKKDARRKLRLLHFFKRETLSVRRLLPLVCFVSVLAVQIPFEDHFLASFLNMWKISTFTKAGPDYNRLRLLCWVWIQVHLFLPLIRISIRNDVKCISWNVPWRQFLLPLPLLWPAVFLYLLSVFKC